MQPDSPNKFSPTTVTLHWLVGLTIIGLLGVGWYMAEYEVYPLYSWHKSIGVLIFLLVVPRVLWRMKNGWPVPVSQYSSIEQILAKIVHWVLILGSVLMPISGFMMSAVGGFGVAVFGFELVAMNPDPSDPTQMLAHNKDIAMAAHSAHHWIGEAMIIAVLLHIAGAFKHHLIDKDGTLRRMLGANLEG